MNAQADTGTRSTVYGDMGGGAKTRTVGARACAKNVYNSLLDEVARKSGPGAGPEENVRRFEVSPPGATTTSPSSGLSASRRRLGRSRL